jgi:hypothetical protein
MSSRKNQVLAFFGALSLLTLIGATAATSQDSGIDVYNGDIRMHSNNITDAGLVDGVDLSNPGSNIQISNNQYAVSDNWIDENGDTVSGDITMGSNDLIFQYGGITQGSGGGGSNLIYSENQVTLASDYPDGNRYYCSIDSNGDWSCDGSKNWVHSLNSTHEAVYSSQESPEVRAVYEGNTSIQNGVANVSLPTHFSKTVSDDRPNLRVQATPHELATVAVTERTDEYVVIEASEDVNVDFRVTGIREGYEDKQVVREKEEIEQEGGN